MKHLTPDSENLDYVMAISAGILTAATFIAGGTLLILLGLILGLKLLCLGVALCIVTMLAIGVKMVGRRLKG